MINDVYFKGEKINSFNDILQKYSKNEFNSPYRSTIPLLVLFNSEHWDNFGLITNASKKNIKYTFECETPVKKGIGRPSCTDLMIENQDICIAVEAKRSEPPYESVGKWRGNSENKKLVLEGWLEIIGDKINSKIDDTLSNDLPYQLIHRVASACSKNKVFTHVIYLVLIWIKPKRIII